MKNVCFAWSIRVNEYNIFFSWNNPLSFWMDNNLTDPHHPALGGSRIGHLEILCSPGCLVAPYCALTIETMHVWLVWTWIFIGELLARKISWPTAILYVKPALVLLDDKACMFNDNLSCKVDIDMFWTAWGESPVPLSQETQGTAVQNYYRFCSVCFKTYYDLYLLYYINRGW